MFTMKRPIQPSFIDFFLIFSAKIIVCSSEEKHYNNGQENPPLYTCTECWCLPSNGPEGDCPKLDNRRITYDAYIMDMFRSYRLTLTPWEDLPHLIPDGGGGVYDYSSSSSYADMYQPVCTPYPYLSEWLGIPPCLQPPHFEDDAVCGFLYEADDDSCEYGRHYGMKTFGNWKKARDAGAVVTHTRECGVCSDANDLAVNLLPDFDLKSFQCAELLMQPSSSAINDVFDCYSEVMGFTPECAWLWTTNSVWTFQMCLDPCLENIGQPPNDPITCALNSCLICDEEQSGPVFKLFSGRTRRNSGIITPVVRECCSIANIRQDPCFSAPNSKSKKRSKKKRKRRKHSSKQSKSKKSKSNSKKSGKHQSIREHNRLRKPNFKGNL